MQPGMIPSLRRLSRPLRDFGVTIGSTLPAFLPGAITHTEDARSVLITFDDGPHPRATMEALDALDETRLRAMFFCLGVGAEAHPELIRRCAERGHSLQVHGWDHRDHVLKNRRALRDELTRAVESLGALTGTKPSFFRPPYGRWNPLMNSVLHELELRLVLWSVMPGDYSPTATADDVVRRLDESCAGGDIVVLHDNATSAGKIGQVVRHLAATLARKGLRVMPEPGTPAR
jgi:peptidoglycan-N-acetylglucosamine deacetylase